MNWTELISTKRQLEKESDPAVWQDHPISEFEKDYRDIVTSAAFRRLQDKTQVFPLDQSDFVRTRLTHSLEVSTIAKQLGIMITQNKTHYLPEEFKSNESLSHDIPSILSCAGLLHDLGNPPFGHFGEIVIREWFKKVLKNKDFKFMGEPVADVLDIQMKNDLCQFEGNAQALRILGRAHWSPNGNKANLSYAVINTLIKYPTNSVEVDSKSSDVRIHKMGYFLAEQKLYGEVRNCVGISCKGDRNTHVRYPLTFLMEAADDIAYATADLEDAFKKGMFTIDEFIKYYQEESKKLTPSEKKKKTIGLLHELKKMLGKVPVRNVESELVVFQKWIEYVKHWFMYVVAYSFSKNYKSIMNGIYSKDMFEEGYHTHSIKILKKAMSKFVFRSASITKLELSARKIITSLLDDFIPAVLHWDIEDEKYSLTKSDEKLIGIISENLKQDYQNSKGEESAYNLYLRFLMVTDYISGMTDSYAKKLYQDLNGIS